MNSTQHEREEVLGSTQDEKLIPAPTAGTLVFAFGTTLVFAGLVTSWMVAVSGLCCAIWGIVIWWRDVYPFERMEHIPEGMERAIVPPEPPTEAQAQAATPRQVLPLQVPRYSSGIKGGVAGGIAMAVVALAWGFIFHRSFWLPINLLAGIIMPSEGVETLAQLSQFAILPLIAGVLIHVAFSLGVGLLFGVAVPMMPKHPIIFGGIAAPVLWSGLLFVSLEVVDPTLAVYIDWWWFIASQFAFGVVAGWVVARSEHIETLQYLTPAQRVKLEQNRGGDSS